MKGLAALVVLLASCAPSPASSAQAHPSPAAAVHSFAGGCAGTVLTDALPPVWAQGGWSQPAAPWPVPWAFGTGKDAVAYVFATQLVAGASPRVNGTNNKILWESKDLPSGGGVAIDAHPMGQTQPVVTIAGGPSIVDLPTAGCWTFALSWSSNGRHTSTINLEVLPAGTVP
jgi:hypothetical protein